MGFIIIFCIVVLGLIIWNTFVSRYKYHFNKEDLKHTKLGTVGGIEMDFKYFINNFLNKPKVQEQVEAAQKCMDKRKKENK